jgi:hypothetical protein
MAASLRGREPGYRGTSTVGRLYHVTLLRNSDISSSLSNSYRRALVIGDFERLDLGEGTRSMVARLMGFLMKLSKIESKVRKLED